MAVAGMRRKASATALLMRSQVITLQWQMIMSVVPIPFISNLPGEGSS
jgi:hypothetical protein